MRITAEKPKKKMGRPTDNPKPFRITARIDVGCKYILDKYCEQEHIEEVEAVRRAIRKLEADLKK